MKYSIITFGCRVNQADSLEIEEELLRRGGEPSSAACADVVVVNTCSVTATSDQGARQTLRRLARDNPTARLVVTGCYASREPADIAGLPHVVEVIPNAAKASVASRVIWHTLKHSELSSETITTSERFGSGEGACGQPIEPGLAGRTAFTLRVQTGCDEPCTYCIIPTTRGRGRSRLLSDVLGEVDRVIKAGFKEIALTGVHLGSYGRDLPTPEHIDLTRLLNLLNARSEDVRFRISSLEPMDCTPSIIELVARSERFAQHFHLPLQHASDRVLRTMRRPYNLDYYRRLVDDIRARMPNAAIGSDIIVGFPGETDADFEELIQYLERSPLTYLHVFPYSDRPGTPAAAMAGKVHGSVVRARAGRVRHVGAMLASRFKERQAGTIHRALTIEDGSVAITGNHLRVAISAGRNRNEWVDVTITGAGPVMMGEILNGNQN